MSREIRRGPFCVYSRKFLMTTVTLRRQIEENGFGLSMTRGRSMRPLIWGGSHCVVVVPLSGHPDSGDMVMFRQKRECGEISIVHRVVEVKHDSGGSILYVTRGDNCLWSETVHPEDVVGRVVEIHRTVSYRPWFIIGSKTLRVTDAAYKRYVDFWTAIWPLRRVCYIARERLGAVRRRVMGLMRKENR